MALIFFQPVYLHVQFSYLLVEAGNHMVYPNVKTKNDQIEEGTQPEGWTQVTEQNERQQVFYNLKPDGAVHGYKIQNTPVSSFSPSELYHTL